MFECFNKMKLFLFIVTTLWNTEETGNINLLMDTQKMVIRQLINKKKWSGAHKNFTSHNYK